MEFRCSYNNIIKERNMREREKGEKEKKESDLKSTPWLTHPIDE